MVPCLTTASFSRRTPRPDIAIRFHPREKTGDEGEAVVRHRGKDQGRLRQAMTAVRFARFLLPSVRDTGTMPVHAVRDLPVPPPSRCTASVFKRLQMKHLILMAALLAAPAAWAHDYTVGDLSVAHPFAFATVGNAPVGGGYMEITNTGEIDDVLLSVSVAPELAGMAQLHEMAMDDGIMRMGQVEGGIVLPAGETTILKSGGLHVMFMRLTDGLDVGEEIPATLTFENAGTLDIVFTVEARGETPAHGNDHNGHGN